LCSPRRHKALYSHIKEHKKVEDKKKSAVLEHHPQSACKIREIATKEA
jgi:hypothetical protein